VNNNLEKMEGSGRGLSEVLLQHMSGRIKIRNENLTTAGLPDEDSKRTLLKYNS
jgi:hypothetical protein